MTHQEYDTLLLGMDILNKTPRLNHGKGRWRLNEDDVELIRDFWAIMKEHGLCLVEADGCGRVTIEKQEVMWYELT